MSLLVEEAADAEVAIRVDSAIVERLAPPWIVQRLHGALPPPEVDAQRRKDFNRRILSIISKGMEREGRGRSRRARGSRRPGSGAAAALIARSRPSSIILLAVRVSWWPSAPPPVPTVQNHPHRE